MRRILNTTIVMYRGNHSLDLLYCFIQIVKGNLMKLNITVVIHTKRFNKRIKYILK